MELKRLQYDKEKLRINFNEALKKPEFLSLVKELDLDYDRLMNYTSKLEKSCMEQKNCQTCPGLHSCKNNIKGYVFSPSLVDDRLIFNLKACSYQEEYSEKTASFCDYYEMPESLRTARMKDISVDDANRVKAIKWLKNFYDTYQDNPNQKGLYLHGSFGSGKTFLICAMLNELSKKCKDIKVVYYPELLRSLKESFDKTDFGDRMAKLKYAKILFLDDVGAESVTPWSRDEILGTILQYRMDAKLPTFFSSNLTIDELETHLSTTKNGVDKLKSRRIIERVRQLTDDIELISKNRRV